MHALSIRTVDSLRFSRNPSISEHWGCRILHQNGRNKDGENHCEVKYVKSQSESTCQKSDLLRVKLKCACQARRQQVVHKRAVLRDSGVHYAGCT